MSQEHQPFALFANCKLCKGYSRSVILDLQQSIIHLIPNSLYEILDQYSNSTIEAIKRDFKTKDHTIIDEYFHFLHSNNLILHSEVLNLFPSINEIWEHPNKIDNCIVDFYELNVPDFVLIA